VSFADDAAQACSFVVERIRELAGSRWTQGERRPPLPTRSENAAVRTVATMRLYQLADPPARALTAWSNGDRSVVLLDRVPLVRTLLGWQARGIRCVSLLEDDAAAGAQGTRLAFALHDLCHLEKFVDPQTHAAQVGFFARLAVAWDSPELARLHARYDDEAWRSDLAHVAADMNGSPVFLLAALKMKVKMAERRALAREERRPPPTGGPLTLAEHEAFVARCEELFSALRLDGALLAACRVVSTRRDAETDARVIHEVLSAEGRAILAAADVQKKKGAT
jgi:hypothetical protein